MIASILLSCDKGIGEAEKLDLSETPMQRINDMFAVQTKNGKIEMRLEAPVMEHYDDEDESRDLFPEGISVFAYTDEGLLESVIVADNARHVTPKSSGDEDEIWEAYGDVILHNVIKQETMETDTLYWDQTKREVYTDCYVKMYSPDGFTQGYGMRSDDHMRFLDSNDVLYVEVVGHSLLYHTATDVWKDWGTLKAISERLAQYHFIPASRYCLVNLDKIQSVTGSALTLVGGSTIAVSRSRKKPLLEALSRYYRQ